jgi:5-hydroxyisourate hydrolase
MSSAHPRDTVSVSTHVLDTSVGRPAASVAVHLSARTGSTADWSKAGGSVTDADGRCTDLPPLPQGTTQVRLRFETGPYLHRTDPQAEEKQDASRTRDSAPATRDRDGFFPEVTVVFTVTPGEHHHVPLLLNPYGYSVYRGS